MRVFRADRAAWIVVLAAVMAFSVPSAASAEHVNIAIDGNLADLIAAVNSDPDAGCSLTSPPGNIFTQACQFVNGYDIINGYVFLDFEGAGGGVESPFELYAGFEVTGIIGDYDGDGNPDVFSNTQGGCAIPANETGTNRDGRTGIGTAESYTVEIRDCVSGGLFRLGVKDNQVVNFETNLAIPGATYARSGSFLELRIPDLQAQFPGLDLCDLSISLTSNAEFDGLGEDRTTSCAIEVPISIDVEKTPDTQAACIGDDVTFTITVTNDGACVLNDVRVTDVLGAGLSFVSSNPASTGDAQNREWLYDNVNLAPGGSLSITLVANVDGPCAPNPFRNDVTAEGVHDVNPDACPGRSARSDTDTDFAEVTCLPEPCVDLVECRAPESACDGDQITIAASARNCSDGPETIVLEILGPGGAVIHSETFNNVAAGASVNTEFQVTFDCETAPATYNARARASNDCGQSDDVTSSGCTVTCDNGPGVSVRCVIDVATAKEGDPLVVTGYARNDGDAPADIVLTVDGSSQNFDDVAAGVEVNHSVNRTMPACEAGQSITFNVSATSTNECGSTTANSSCSVECEVEEGFCCWLTFGGHENGRIREGHKDHTFGGNVGPPPSGSWQHVVRDGREIEFNFHSHDAHVTFCGDNGGEGPCHPAGEANYIEIAGTGFYSEGSGSREVEATFVARIDDNGEPGNWPDRNGCGTPDHYTLTVYNLDGSVAFEVDDFFSGGNAQIHECKNANQIDGNTRGGRQGQLSAGSTGGTVSTDDLSALELYRPTPNPFSNTTSIAYAVGGHGEAVQIGIYDVAGRLVRELVNGAQSPGRYTVTWDGRDADGATVTKGVYFLRAYVGGQRMVNAARILYLR